MSTSVRSLINTCQKILYSASLFEKQGKKQASKNFSRLLESYDLAMCDLEVEKLLEEEASNWRFEIRDLILII